MITAFFNGTICRDIEMKYTKNKGTAVISNSLAFNTKDANGNQKTVFLDFEAYGKTAELINQYYQKGDMLCGIGEIAQDEWQDKDTGKTRTKHKIIISKLEFTKSPKAWANQGADGAGNSRIPQSYDQAPAQQPSQNQQKHGNYEQMPPEVTAAVARNNANYNQAPAQNMAQDLNEIPF